MAAFLLLLYLLHSSGAFPMHLPGKGSNSEEGMPYGPYAYPNLQMPHAGSMFGFGAPQYSQMIQLQQALSQQPFAWPPQGGDRSENHKAPAMPQMPRFQLPIPQQPFNPVQPPLPNRPQTQPTYQHVTNKPQPPLQPPPASDSQPPQMFPPFPNPMNPYQPFWQQGNYFPFFGYGARPPYNSEEMNEDEEPAKAEKEAPKTETPATEAPTNATVAETNSTIVDQSQGNATGHNPDIAGENTQNPNVGPDGHTNYHAGVPITRVIQGRTINISPGSSRTSYHLVRSPNQETVLRYPQRNYYAIDRIPSGHGGQSFHNNIQPQSPIANKVPFINSPRTGYNRDTPNIHVSSRAAVPRGNVMGEARGILPDSRLNTPKKEGAQQYNGNVVLKPGDPSNRQAIAQKREHSAVLINKNLPNQKIIIIPPQRNDPPYRSSVAGHSNNEYFIDSNRRLIIEAPNPRGIFSTNPNNPPNIQNDAVIHKGNSNNPGMDKNVLVKTEDPFIHRGTSPHTDDATIYHNEERHFDRGSSWNHRQSNRDTGTGNAGPRHETIYLVSSVPQGDLPMNSENNQKPVAVNSLNTVWDQKTEQDGSPRYNTLGPGERIPYPESEFYSQGSSFSYPGKKPWNNGVDHITTQNENSHAHSYDVLGPQRNTQIAPAGQSKQDVYVASNRTPLKERYILVSSQDPPKYTEISHLPVKGHSYQIKQFPINSHKVITSLDQNSYYTGFETDSQTLSRNAPYSANRPFDPIESIHYSPGDELHLLENEPYSEINSWAYHPEEFPLGHNENLNYDSYPSGMRVQSQIQREIGMDHGGSRHYSCTLPISEKDQVSGLPYSLLYVCCRLTHESGYPLGNVDNPHDIRITLKEYNEGVPYADRTHRQHTRNVIDQPKINDNQNSHTIIPSCNMSVNNENMLIPGSPIPCEAKGCDVQNLEYPYGGFDGADRKPCRARGDADNYLALDHEVPRYQRKNVMAPEKPESPSINVQEDGSLHGGIENDGRVKQGTGKLMRVLTCSQNRRKYLDGLSTNMDKNKANALKHDIPTGEAATAGVDTQDAENKNDPGSNIPDCMLLK